MFACTDMLTYNGVKIRINSVYVDRNNNTSCAGFYPTNKIKCWFTPSAIFLFFSLPLKCYGYLLSLLPPLLAEVMFYPQESHYLASPPLLSPSPQPSRLSAILLCHFNLFLWLSYDLQPVCVQVWACLCVLLSPSLFKGIGRAESPSSPYLPISMNMCLSCV